MCGCLFSKSKGKLSGGSIFVSIFRNRIFGHQSFFFGSAKMDRTRVFADAADLSGFQNPHLSAASAGIRVLSIWRSQKKNQT